MDYGKLAYLKTEDLTRRIESVEEAKVGFDLNGDGDTSDTIALTIEYDEVVNLVATITSSKRLNVRAKKSTENTIIDRLDPGTEVQVVEVDGGWTSF